MSTTQEFGSVLLERQDAVAVAVVTLNRPERRNALGGSLREDLVAAMAFAGKSADIGAIVLTGAGNCFCAGGDLRMLLDGVEAPGGRPLRDKVEPQRDTTLLCV